MNERLNKIYQYLSTQNIKDFPVTYADFENLMQDNVKAGKIHSYLLSKNVKDIDTDFNIFSEFVGRKKKVPSGASAQVRGVASEMPSKELQTPLIESGTQPQPLESDKELQGQLKEKPTAKTLGEWVTGAAGVFDQKLASMFDDIDFIQTSLQDALNQVIVGKEGANVLKKMREDGTLVPQVNPSRPMKAIADAIRWSASGAKPLPQGVGGAIVSGAMSVIPDLMAAAVMPEIKAGQVLQKLGIPVLSRFGIAMGTEGAIENAKIAEDGTPFQKLTMPVIGGIEGYLTGQVFDWMGQGGAQIGNKIASKIIPKVETTTQAINKALIQHGTSSLSNAVMFGGYGNLDEFVKTGKISPETFATNAGIGIVLSGRETGKLLFAKGINAFIGTPTEIIVRSAQSDLKPEDLAKQAQDKISKIESGQSTDREGDAVLASMLQRQAELKAMADEIKTNHDDVIKTINESEAPKSVKDLLINKINEVVNHTDERAQEVKPFTDKIKGIDDKLKNIKNNSSLSSVERDIQSEQLNAQKEMLKGKVLGVYKKYEGNIIQKPAKYSLNGEEIERKQAKDIIEKAKDIKDVEGLKVENDAELQGKMADKFVLKVPTENKPVFIGTIGEGDTALDQYNVLTPDGKEATFSVPRGSNDDIINAKKEEILIKFKEGTENAESRRKGTEESSQQTQGLESGEEERIRLRDNAQTRMETIEGEKVVTGIKDLEQKPAKVQEEPKQPKITPKEAKSDIISQEQGVTPPPSEKSVETQETGGKPEMRKMEVARKAVEESMLLKDDTKQNIKDSGIEYVIQKDSTLDSEIEELVKIYGTDATGLDQLQALVRKEGGMSGDRRNWLTALLITERAKQIELAPDFATKVEQDRKLTDLIIYATQKGVLSGRETRSFKKIGEALLLYPAALRSSVIEKIDRKNRDFFDTNQLDKIIKKEVEEYFKNKPTQNQEYTPDVEISKVKIAQIRKERQDILSQLKDSFKKPSGTLSGSVIPLSAEQVSLISKLVGSYIQEGYYRTEVIVRKLRKDWEGVGGGKITDEEALSVLPKEVDGKSLDEWNTLAKEERGVQKKKQPKVKTPPTEEELVKKLLDKAGKIMSRKQLQNFVSKYLTEIKDKGLLNDQEFRNILAEVLGLDYVSGESEAKIDRASRSVADYNKKLGILQGSFNDWMSEYTKDSKSDKLIDLRQKLNNAIKDADKAMSTAKKDYQFVHQMLQENPDFINRLGTMIQGGLLIPSSQVANVAGNLMLIPETAPSYMIAGGFDAITSKVAETLQHLVRKVSPQEHPWLYRKLNAYIPSTERTIMPFEYSKGYMRGFGHNFLEGLKQTFSVEGPVGTELMKGNIQRGVHPIDALMHVYKTATRQEKRAFGTFMADLMEASPAGYFTNAHFRGLNMFDLPFRGGGEGGILYEAFRIKWDKKINEANQIKNKAERDKRIDYLNGMEEVEREKFYREPDKETLELAKKQGQKGTFSQNSAITNTINSFERFAQENKDSPLAAGVNGALRVLKILNMPYVTVPVNILGKSLEMSIPVFPTAKMFIHIQKAASAKEKGDYTKAHVYRRLAMEDFGNAAVAGIVSTIATSLALAGIIQWTDKDKKIKAAQQDIGKEGLRFNVDAFHRWLKGESTEWRDGDDTYSLKRMGVLSVQLGSVAQAVGEMTPEEVKKFKQMDFIQKAGKISGEMLQYAPDIALQQSIMTGINNMVTGLMGSEAEKDRWVVGMATALSTATYPNTMANVSQSIDGYFRETRDLSKDEDRVATQLKNTFKDRMFMGNKLPTKVSIWGQPIKRIPQGENPILYGMLGIAKHKKYQQYTFGAELYDFYDRYRKTNPDEAKGLFPSLPSASTKVGWDDAKMIPEQYEQYQMRVGQLRAQEAETYFNSDEWDMADDEDKINQLTRIYSKTRQGAEAELFSWIKYKDKEPAMWNIMLKDDALPIPYMAKKIKHGLKEWKLTSEDIEMLNSIALERYAERIIPWLEDNKKNLDELKKSQKKTRENPNGDSRFINKTNDAWRSALNFAKERMDNILREETNE